MKDRNRTNQKKSIRVKLIGIIGLALLVSIIGSSALSYAYSKSTLKNVYQEENAASSVSSANSIQIYLSKHEKSLEELSLHIATVYDGHAENKRIHEFLENTKSQDTSLVATYFIDAKSGRMDIAPWVDFGNALETRAFKETKAADKTHWMEVYKDNVTGDMMTSVITPVKKDGQFIGVLGYDISLDAIGDLRNQLQKGKENKLLVLDNQGVVVSSFLKADGMNLSTEHSGKNEEVENYIKDEKSFKKEFKWVDSLYEKETVNTTANFEGTSYHVSSSTITETGWKVISVTANSVISNKLKGITLIGIGTSLGGLIIGGIIAYLISRMILNYLRNFNEVTEKASQGDLTVSLNVNSNDEIGEFATNFNTMLENIRNMTKKIQTDFSRVDETSQSLNEIASQNSSSIAEVTSSIEEIATANNQQSLEVEKGSMAIQDLNKTINHLVEQSKSMEISLQKANQGVGSGRKDVTNLEGSYRNLESSLSKVEMIMNDLSDKSKNISQVTKGKSDLEIMRFCQSFMTELSKYIGPDIDVPAGDIGVGAREIGYMFGQYKRLKGAHEAGVLTGKGIGYGGSLGRKEATGYGLVYFVEEMLKSQGLSFNDSTVVVSGSGNVSIYAMEKAMQLGAKVIACSDSSGYVYDPNGIDLDTVKQLKEVENKRIYEYVKKHPDAIYQEGFTGIWEIPCDIALPCATQNELNKEAAEKLISNGIKAVGEGANMPSTLEAIDSFIQHHVLFAPAKAANAGGVAVSALEIAQNSARIAWTQDEVDKKLQDIMKNIYSKSIKAAEDYATKGNLVAGANIAGFIKVADAMIEQGII